MSTSPAAAVENPSITLTPNNASADESIPRIYRPPPRLVIVTNDDGPPGQFSPFLAQFLDTLRKTLKWNIRVIIPNTQKSWIGKGFDTKTKVGLTYYHAATGRTLTPAEKREMKVPDEDVYTMMNTACINIALNHLVSAEEVDLVISGPNFGRNTSAGSSMSSGTVAGALEASILGKKSIAISFTFDSRSCITDIPCIENACDTSILILQRLWEGWPVPSSTHALPSSASTFLPAHRVPDLYNVNIPLAPAPIRPIVFTTFQPGGYGSLYIKSGEGVEAKPAEEDDSVFEFRPSISLKNEMVEGSDSRWAIVFASLNVPSAIFQKLVSITPMKARYHCIEEDLKNEERRLFQSSFLPSPKRENCKRKMLNADKEDGADPSMSQQQRPLGGFPPKAGVTGSYLLRLAKEDSRRLAVEKKWKNGEAFTETSVGALAALQLRVKTPEGDPAASNMEPLLDKILRHVHARSGEILSIYPYLQFASSAAPSSKTSTNVTVLAVFRADADADSAATTTFTGTLSSPTAEAEAALAATITFLESSHSIESMLATNEAGGQKEAGTSVRAYVVCGKILNVLLGDKEGNADFFVHGEAIERMRTLASMISEEEHDGLLVMDSQTSAHLEALPSHYFQKAFRYLLPSTRWTTRRIVKTRTDIVGFAPTDLLESPLPVPYETQPDPGDNGDLEWPPSSLIGAEAPTRFLKAFGKSCEGGTDFQVMAFVGSSQKPFLPESANVGWQAVKRATEELHGANLQIHVDWNGRIYYCVALRNRIKDLKPFMKSLASVQTLLQNTACTVSLSVATGSFSIIQWVQAGVSVKCAALASGLGEHQTRRHQPPPSAAAAPFTYFEPLLPSDPTNLLPGLLPSNVPSRSGATTPDLTSNDDARLVDKFSSEASAQGKPMYGYRDEKMQILNALKGFLDDGKMRAVVVEGPSGIGKSTVMDFFTTAVRYYRVDDCVTRISEDEALTPFSSVVSAIQYLLRIFTRTLQPATNLQITPTLSMQPVSPGASALNLPDSESVLKSSATVNSLGQVPVSPETLAIFLIRMNEDPSLAPLLARFFEDVPVEQTEATRGLSANAVNKTTVSLVARILARWCKNKRTVFIFDDMQWIDSMSLEVLAQVFKAKPDQLFLFLCSRPIKDLDLKALKAIAASANILHLQLTGLQEDDVKAYLLASFSDMNVTSVDPELLQVFTEKTSSNPLSLEMAVSVLRRRNTFSVLYGGMLVFAGGVSKEVLHLLDGNVAETIMIQFQRLTLDFQNFLVKACIFGQYFDLEDVRQLLAEEPSHGTSVQKPRRNTVRGPTLLSLKELIDEQDHFGFLRARAASGGHHVRNKPGGGGRDSVGMRSVAEGGENPPPDAEDGARGLESGATRGLESGAEKRSRKKSSGKGTTGGNAKPVQTVQRNYYFRHIKICAAIYGSLTQYDQARLHERVGLIIEKRLTKGSRDLLLPMLYHHFLLSGNVEKRVRYGEELGFHFVEKGFRKEATTILRDLVTYVSELDPTALPADLQHPDRQAKWYAQLATAAAANYLFIEVRLAALNVVKLLNLDVGVLVPVWENKVKELQKPAAQLAKPFDPDVGFPAPELPIESVKNMYGAALKRVLRRHLLLFLTTRGGRTRGLGLSRTKLSLEGALCADAVLSAVFWLGIADDSTYKEYVTLVLLHLLNIDISVADAVPHLWANRSMCMAYFCIMKSPPMCRMFFRAARDAAKKCRLEDLSPSIWFYTGCIMAMKLDRDDVYAYVDAFESLMDKRGDIAHYQRARTIRFLMRFPRSFDEAEHILMLRFNDGVEEDLLVAHTSVCFYLMCCIVMGKTDRIEWCFAKLLGYRQLVIATIKRFPYYGSMPIASTRAWIAILRSNPDDAAWALTRMAYHGQLVFVVSHQLVFARFGFLCLWPCFTFLDRLLRNPPTALPPPTEPLAAQWAQETEAATGWTAPQRLWSAVVGACRAMRTWYVTMTGKLYGDWVFRELFLAATDLIDGVSPPPPPPGSGSGPKTDPGDAPPRHAPPSGVGDATRARKARAAAVKRLRRLCGSRAAREAWEDRDPVLLGLAHAALHLLDPGGGTQAKQPKASQVEDVGDEGGRKGRTVSGHLREAVGWFRRVEARPLVEWIETAGPLNGPVWGG
ncbi:hypothetical protein HDU96_001970 [Phlyctochytrium bullatum]|nr:hypothetical protein HDU96_001970 [Phlyctochytrium bullatum]